MASAAHLTTDAAWSIRYLTKVFEKIAAQLAPLAEEIPQIWEASQRHEFDTTANLDTAPRGGQSDIMCGSLRPENPSM